MLKLKFFYSYALQVFNNKITHCFLQNIPKIKKLYSPVRQFNAFHVLLLSLTVKSYNGYSSKHFSWNRWWHIGHFNQSLASFSSKYFFIQLAQSDRNITKDS